MGRILVGILAVSYNNPWSVLKVSPVKKHRNQLIMSAYWIRQSMNCCRLNEGFTTYLERKIVAKLHSEKERHLCYISEFKWNSRDYNVTLCTTTDGWKTLNDAVSVFFLTTYYPYTWHTVCMTESPIISSLYGLRLYSRVCTMVQIKCAY